MHLRISSLKWRLLYLYPNLLNEMAVKISRGLVALQKLKPLAADSCKTHSFLDTEVKQLSRTSLKQAQGEAPWYKIA